MLSEDVQIRLDSLTRPRNSLGFLEKIAANIPAMQDRVIPDLHHCGF